VGLTDKLKELQLQAAASAKDLQTKAAATVAENHERITATVDEVAGAANARTGGRYAEQIARAERQAKTAVERIAERAPDSPA
jgi:hypothetical protein